MSNLDLLLPLLDFGIFFCYKKPPALGPKEVAPLHTAFGSYSNMVEVLKKAMAQALVAFYAFADEVVQNSIGEPEILCNNHGVDFVEAFADVKLKDLNFYCPDESVEGKLVPKKKCGVMAVQAPFLGLATRTPPLPISVPCKHLVSLRLMSVGRRLL